MVMMMVMCAMVCVMMMMMMMMMCVCVWYSTSTPGCLGFFLVNSSAAGVSARWEVMLMDSL